LKECYIEKEKTINLGKNHIQARGKLSFYPDGELLSCEIEKDCKLVYKGKEISVPVKNDISIWFDKAGNLIAIENCEDEVMKVNGKEMIIPEDIDVGYNDYQTRDVSFISLKPEFVILPENIKLLPDTEKVFVKADQFYKEDGYRINATQVKAIMFPDDAVIKVNGKEIECMQMNWIDLGLYPADKE
jgi:hypothetical protein